jgi:NAD+ synthase
MALAAQIVAWLQEFAAQANAKGYVLGLSGGIDSACSAVLCQRAMGHEVLAAVMPCHSQATDAEMAHLVAHAFGLRTITVDLGPACDALVAALPPGVSALAEANIKPRLRMATLYALAQTHGYFVAGTGNKSEIQVGYYTKYGDGGVDVEPLGNLYKWQVRQLARELGVPQAVIDRPPTAGLRAGQTDEAEMGMTYDALDATLAVLETGQTEGIDPALLARVQRMVAASAHKRAMPPVCPLRT